MRKKDELAEQSDVPFFPETEATEQEANKAHTAFFSQSGIHPSEAELPVFAMQMNSPRRLPCLVVKREDTSKGTLVVVQYLEGGLGMGKLKDFEFYKDPPDEFRSLFNAERAKILARKLQLSKD